MKKIPVGKISPKNTEEAVAALFENDKTLSNYIYKGLKKHGKWIGVAVVFGIMAELDIYILSKNQENMNKRIEALENQGCDENKEVETEEG